MTLKEHWNKYYHAKAQYVIAGMGVLFMSPSFIFDEKGDPVGILLPDGRVIPEELIDIKEEIKQ